MIRAILALVLIAAVVAAAIYVADHPGHVAIEWQGWLIETSVGVLAAAIAALVIAVMLLALLLAGLRRLPRNLRRRRATRRQHSGETILTSGLVALAAGQAAEAGRHARRAAALLDGAPIPLLLAAEAATRQGDTAAARLPYTTLIERPETEFLGLRGLIGQALRAGEDGVARRLAERARQLRPDAGWLLETLLVLEGRAGDWSAARATLTGAVRRKTLPTERLRHHQGVVLYELSRAAEQQGDQRTAAILAAQAQARAPDLAGVALHHARLLLALGRRRAATRAIERAWQQAPHPELARFYLDLRPDSGPLARAAAIQRLAARNPAAIESHLAVAEAALAAQLWGEARRHLGLALTAAADRPTPRLCRLMARLEESETRDQWAAREWLDRAIAGPPDPAHICARCGGVSPEWQALCRDCGEFDTLSWRQPPAGVTPTPLVASTAPSLLPSPEMPGEGAARRPGSGAVPGGLAAAAQWDK